MNRTTTVLSSLIKVVMIFNLLITFTSALQITVLTTNNTNNTTTIEIPTRYTTIGSIPQYPVHVSKGITFLNVEDIDCKNEVDNGDERVRNLTNGKLVIFYSHFPVCLKGMSIFKVVLLSSLSEVGPFPSFFSFLFAF